MYKTSLNLIPYSCMKHQTEQPDEDVTERMSSQVHETTQTSLMTLPTTTETLTITTTASIEPSTTTLRIVDATLAVDKVEPT